MLTRLPPCWMPTWQWSRSTHHKQGEWVSAYLTVGCAVEVVCALLVGCITHQMHIACNSSAVGLG
jgi:hypothetical protein